MLPLPVSLVNSTVVEAVRVALDQYVEEGHALMAFAESGDRMPIEQERIIRKAILKGLQKLQAAQQGIDEESRRHEATSTKNGDKTEATFESSARAAPPPLHKALVTLKGNATATQEVVERILSRLHAHLRCDGDAACEAIGAEGPSASAVYAATPEVTRLVNNAVTAQLGLVGNRDWADGLQPPVVENIAVHLRSVSSEQWMWLSMTLVLGYLFLHFVLGRLLGLCGWLGRRHRPRTSTVLVGLPDSGKTALFAQLVHRRTLDGTRTSMKDNRGPLRAALERGLSPNATGVMVVDCPGHARLREAMLHAVGGATNVVVVIDSISVQDGQQDGVAALADLLLTLLQSPEFYGVRRLLFACTKRDEPISYTSRAVRKLLEAAMVAAIESRRMALERVESVRDSRNTIIARNAKSVSSGGYPSSGPRHVLYVETADRGDGVADSAVTERSRWRRGTTKEEVAAHKGGADLFNFDQLGIPCAFVDVSSRPNAAVHTYSPLPIEEFLLS